MADQDDFEPGGRCWRKTRQAYLQRAAADEVAFSTERVLRNMLRVYGESKVLPQLLVAFARLTDASKAPSLWDAPASPPESPQSSRGAQVTASIEETIARLESGVSDRRIDAVMLRTARCFVVAGALSVQPLEFVTQVLCDVARHCCLDDARASSIGLLFSSDLAGRLQAHAHHQEVVASLIPGAQFLARQYLRDPTAQHVRCRSHRPPDDRLYTERLA